jgi:hypothetical protein
VSWQRLTAAQLGLQEPGGTPQGIDFAASQGTATVITDRGAGVWLSTDSGAHWTPVTVPVDHGAQNSISGVSFDGAGLVLVRPGRTASGASDGVAYFSKDGRTWQYAGTIAAAGGWSPDAVKGGDYGFVVTGHTTDQYVAYTSTGTGTKWRPTGPLGSTSSGPGFTPAIGPGGNVIAAGKTNATRTNQQGLLIKADTAGHLEPVSLGSIQGGLIPEEAVNSVAVAGNEQVAVGSADGYPAVWRRVAAGPWSLVSALDQVSASTDLAGLVRRDPRVARVADRRSGSSRAHLRRRHEMAARRDHHARPGRRVRRAGGQRPARLRDHGHGGRAGRRVLPGPLVVAGPDHLDQGERRERGGRL